jgi:GR25 family glycosyltransferase involved in LPS biosynthesis
MTNILLYNINNSKANNILSNIINTNNDKNIQIYSNNPLSSDFNISIISVNDANLQSEIVNNKINIIITGIITFDVNNITNSNCKIVSLVRNKVFVENVYTQHQIQDLINENNCKQAPEVVNINPQNDISIPSQNAISIPSQNKNNNNPKEIFRSICCQYLECFKKIHIPYICQNNQCEAILVEFRELPHIEMIIRNAIINLGSDWSYTVVCGNSNHSFIHSICSNISTNIKIVELNYSNIDQNTYNNILLTTDFWNLFSGEKLLIYQEDTLIFKNNICSFLEYDYVGAPFGPSCVTPINVGNGGLSLRTKSVMLAALNNCPPSLFTSHSIFTTNYKKTQHLTLYPEDVYFSQVIQNNFLGKVCPYDKSLTFSSEHIFTNDAFGMHCIWFCNSKWEEYIHNYFINKSRNNNISIYDDDFHAYILHCNDFIDRMQLVDKLKTQLEDMNVSTEIFQSVNTTSCDLQKDNQLDVLKQHDPSLCFYTDEFTFYKPGQIGCYLGHHLAVRHILETGKKGYSLIFEDDAFIDKHFMSNVKNIISFFNNSNTDFDIVYLGFLNNNNGTHIGSNIYSINKSKWLFGAQGLLINNKSVSKLYNNNCLIRHEIDNHYKLLMNEDIITGYYINPGIVKQNRTIKSYIGFHNCVNI